MAVALAAGAMFWVPSIDAARGWFPAPLDDVYIHFDFARSLALGHPFEWIPGQGYSSGETSPLYAVILAVGWAIGFRGKALGGWAALVAVLAIASLVRSVHRLVRPAPALVAWLATLLPLSIGLLDWSLWSGMETAVVAGALGRALVALDETRSPLRGRRITREASQWRLGGWSAILVLLRPEAAIFVIVLAVLAARGAGARSGIAAVLRVALPGVGATLAVSGTNWLATGDARSAGAQLKLLASNPYLSEVDRSRAFVENLITFYVRVVRGELTTIPALAMLLPGLALVAVLARRKRATGAACLIGAIVWVFVASTLGNAQFHNFRYYAPALVLLTLGAGLGLARIARPPQGLPSSRLASAAAVAVGLLAVSAAGARIPFQVRHFRTCTANIRDQQIEIGERIAALPDDARVLLGDAGAIPYVSNRTAIDALGLGGYRKMPFAHAAVHGEAATLELIQRLATRERPTHLALYPNWFGGLTSRFGIEIDRVTIKDNIICGGPTKALYVADWSALDGETTAPGDGSILDEIDVGDVISEEEHAYVPPTPNGGWTTFDILGMPGASDGRKHFDGGRVIPEGGRESFVVRQAPKRGAHATLLVRLDGGARSVRVHTPHETTALTLDPPRDGTWRLGAATLTKLEAGDAIVLEAEGAPFRDYHVWVSER